MNSVSVLAQMNGRIETLNVDYNDRVKKGQVLATINTDLLKLDELQAQAAVDKAQANYTLQVLAVQNAQTLADKGLLSDYDLKTSIATRDSAKADLASAKASLAQIQTQIDQYAIISSPISGIVLQRESTSAKASSEAQAPARRLFSPSPTISQRCRSTPKSTSWT